MHKVSASYGWDESLLLLEAYSLPSFPPTMAGDQGH